ncbi:MAG: methyltransferase domain-containing protein [Candidatus Fermentibacter sp.]|nr:methyltransferase domain-containing protein [Candidatus Fermentibacter sp.]
MPGGWYCLPLEARDAVYRRQACETAALRRFIYGLLNLRSAGSVLEPGCGTGLVLEEVSMLTDAVLTGMDRDAEALSIACSRTARLHAVECDIETAVLPRSGIVLLSHVLLELGKPAEFLRRIRGCLGGGGRLAVLGEYDWDSAEFPGDPGLLSRVKRSMADDGLDLTLAGMLPGLLERSGLRVIHSGSTVSARPFDAGFLSGLPGVLDDGGAAPAGPLHLPVKWAVCAR